jgi:hypothetical protein
VTGFGSATFKHFLSGKDRLARTTAALEHKKARRVKEKREKGIIVTVFEIFIPSS